MKIGDILENGYAGEGNPNKKLMYVRQDEKFIICMTRNGGVCRFPKDDINMKVVGHIEIKF